MNFFDFLNDILLKKSGGNLHKKRDFKNFSSYMLIRYLSMRNNLIPYAKILNQLQTNLNNKQLYILAYKLIPKQKNAFIKYIK